MEQENNIENQEDEIITLYDENGKPVQFTVIATIPYQDDSYFIMQPVEAFEGMEENEAFVLKLAEHNGKDAYEIETDEEIISGINEIYLQLLKEMELE